MLLVMPCVFLSPGLPNLEPSFHSQLVLSGPWGKWPWMTYMLLHLKCKIEFFCGWKWWIRGLVFTVCLWQEDTAQEVITSKSIDMEICRLCLSPWLIIRFIIELLSLPSLWHVTQVPGHTWNSTLRMTGRGGIGRLTEIGQTIHIIISWERKAQGWMGWRRRMRVGWT